MFSLCVDAANPRSGARGGDVLGGPGPARQPRHSPGAPPSRQGAQAAAEVPGGLLVVNT